MASVSTHGNQDKGHHLPPPSKQSLLFRPKSKLHMHRGEIAKIIRECQEESFWKRALPFSLVSMLATQGLVHQAPSRIAWAPDNKKARDFVEAVLNTMRNTVDHQDFKKSIIPSKRYLASNPRFGSLPKVALAGVLGFALGKASYIRVCQSKFHSFEDQLRGAGFGPGHNRHCLLTCEECKIKRGLHEKGSSQPSAS